VSYRLQLRRQLFSLVPVVFLLGAAAFGVWFWLQHQQQASLPALLTHLPGHNAAMGYASVDALRQSGLLQADASPTAREPEYEAFIRKSGFNWERDLDSITWSFTPDARFFFVSGRFDWVRLRAFVKQEGGECRDEFCSIVGSQPDRQISFFPWRSHVMALAVSEDRYAADRLRLEYRHGFVPPEAPFWLHLTGTALKNADPGAPGLRGFLRLLEQTQQATLYLSPQPDAFSLELRALCADDARAAELRRDFTKLTEWLNTLLKVEKQEPGETELAAILSTGKFASNGKTLEGSWPVSRKFLASLVAEE